MKEKYLIEYVTKKTCELEYIPLKELIKVDKFINGNDFYVISFQQTTEVTGNKEQIKIEKYQKIITKDILEKIQQNPTNFNSIIQSSSNENPIGLYKKEFRNLFSQYGIDKNLQHLSENKDITTKDFMAENCFDEIKNQKYELLQFIKTGNKSYNRIYQDNKGSLIIEPIILSYIHGNIDNGEYHLDELVEYLSTRKDVSFISSEEKYPRKEIILYCPLNGKEKGINNIIADIPGYNAEPGRDETINLVYYPTPDVIENLMTWEYDKTKHSKIFDLENYIVREILDCDKFSKNPIIVEETAIPKRKFKS